MEDIVNAFVHLLHDTEQCIRNSPRLCRSPALADFLQDYRKKRLNPIHTRLKRMNSNPYVLSMVGLTNVGKSTLAHALLKHPVAPARNSPTTSIPVEYGHDSEWLMKICDRETQSVHLETFVSSEALAQALKNRVWDVSDADAAKIGRVMVHGPMDLLQDGLVFADTPGFGAAQTSRQQGSHQTNIVNYLRDRVHEVLFCVSGANCTVQPEERVFFASIQELCSTVVVTKWEPGNGHAEMEEYKSRFAQLFPRCEFKFVEAKWAIEGQTNGTPGKLEESGVDELSTFIRERTSIEGRRSAVRHQVQDALTDLRELVREPLHESGLSAVPWREDAILRIRGAAKLFKPPFKNLP